MGKSEDTQRCLFHALQCSAQSLSQARMPLDDVVISTKGIQHDTYKAANKTADQYLDRQTGFQVIVHYCLLMYFDRPHAATADAYKSIQYTNDILSYYAGKILMGRIFGHFRCLFGVISVFMRL